MTKTATENIIEVGTAEGDVFEYPGARMIVKDGSLILAGESGYGDPSRTLAIFGPGFWCYASDKAFVPQEAQA